MEKILVKYSGVVKLQKFDDKEDGLLVIGESGKNVPIPFKRFYFISNLSGRTSARGKHAHKRQEQYIFCLTGSFDLGLDDGEQKQTIRMKDPQCGIRLGAGLWHTMENFSDDCLIGVIADDYYDASDYIRDYDEFKKWVKAKR